MKKMRRTTKVIPILLLALLLTVVPLAGIACDDDDDEGGDGPFTFEMQAPYPETDASGIALAAFQEIVEEKTDGRIKVNASYNGQPIAHTAQFEALQTGALDVAVQQPGYSREVDNNFDFSGALAGLIVSKAHYQAMLADDDYMDFQNNLYETKNIKFLGIVDGYRFAGGYFTTFETDSLWDFEGHTIWSGRPGALEPYEALLGCSDKVFFSQTELQGAIMGGQIDILAFPAILAYAYGLWQMPVLNDYLVRPFYAPYSILMSLEDWEAMSGELQDIVMEEVMPAVQAEVTTKTLQGTKDAMKNLVDELGVDHVNVVPASEEEELYQQLVDYPAFTDRAADMDQDIYELIKDLRPTPFTWSQEIQDIIEYAGLS
ncbi:TRAP transporter substrate-binding protein [Chloroflexota bacterium]